MKILEADLSDQDQIAILQLQGDVINDKIDLIRAGDDKEKQAQIKADMADLQAKIADIQGNTGNG